MRVSSFTTAGTMPRRTASGKETCPRLETVMQELCPPQTANPARSAAHFIQSGRACGFWPIILTCCMTGRSAPTALPWRSAPGNLFT